MVFLKKLSLVKLMTSMTIFGSIGVFVRFIPAERGMIAMLRGLIGAAVLLLFMLAVKKSPSFSAIKKNLPLLIFSGAAIGFNWILLFESYSYTTVAVSTLCYYMAPVFVILASPIFTSERLSPKKILCVLASLVGMLLVSGVLEGGEMESGAVIGIILALGAAIFYASVTIMNKRMREIDSYDMTVCQLFFAAVVIAPYTLLAEENKVADFDLTVVALIIVVGVVHTGIAYLLYFSSVKELDAQTVAVFSYIDPIVAIILSIFVLEEPTTPLVIFGAVIILSSTLVSELNLPKRS